jgi:hypothetical protein
VIALDLYWWFLPRRTPGLRGIKSTDDFIARLRAELGAHRAQNVIVVAHHPIRSGGAARRLHARLLDRPRRLDLLPLLQRAGLIEPTYHEMVRVLGEVLAENPPLAMVGGHDHSLQILEGGDRRAWSS